jgi:hypothetical protein
VCALEEMGSGRLTKQLEVGDIGDYQTTRMAVPTACERRWMNILASFEWHLDTIIAGNPDANEK